MIRPCSMIANPVAQPLRLLHQMGREKHRLAAIAHSADQLPDGSPRLRVESGGEFVEKYHLGLIDQCQGDKQPLFLTLPTGS